MRRRPAHPQSALSLSLPVFAVSMALASAQKLCGKSEYASVGDYGFNNNAWNADDSGQVCTYVSGDTSTNAFNSTWMWTSNPPRVRAYPHVQYNSALLPVQLSNLSTLVLDLSWAMSPASLLDGLSTDPTTQPDADALSSAGVEANVAVDMFLDADRSTSREPANQRYEIMIWLGRFGQASQPLGMDTAKSRSPITQTLAGTEFTLYNGTNSNGQAVFSWVAPSLVPNLAQVDVAPLLHFLPHYGFLPWETYLGVVQFGTETWFASEEIRFEVKSFAAELSFPAPGGGSVDGSANSTSTMDGSPVDTSVAQLPESTSDSGAAGRAMAVPSGQLLGSLGLAALVWGLSFGS